MYTNETKPMVNRTRTQQIRIDASSDEKAELKRYASELNITLRELLYEGSKLYYRVHATQPRIED